MIALALSSIPPAVASTGVQSFPALSARFSESLAPALKKVSLLPENGGVLSYLTSYVASHGLFEKEGWSEGKDVVSTVARAKFWLAKKDLDLATREINSLSGAFSFFLFLLSLSLPPPPLSSMLSFYYHTGWPKKLAADWLQQARNHLEVKQALEVRLPLFPSLLLLLTTRRDVCRSRSGKRRPRVSRQSREGVRDGYETVRKQSEKLSSRVLYFRATSPSQLGEMGG